MSYYLPKLTQAIRARLTGDSSLVTLVSTSGSIRWNEMDRDQAFPFVSLVTGNIGPGAEGFGLRSREFQVDVHICIPAQHDNSSTPTDAVNTMASIEARIDGDWDEQATRAPSYGLDRWQPTLTGTNWNCTHLEYLSSGVLDEPGVLHHVHTYRCYPNKAGAT